MSLDPRTPVKLAEYVIAFLADRGVTHVFGMSGGAAVHLFEAAARHPSLTPIFNQHEQASAMAADGYARQTGRLGVAISTSGPGATNLITGTACSFYDSVPVLMITGQVATHRLKGDRPIRQLGFQETDVLSIFSSLTKYAVQITEPSSIRYHMERAYFEAFHGRPGAVLIDIPDDLQRSPVVHEEMPAFDAPVPASPAAPDEHLDELFRRIEASERPALVLGGGLTTPWQGDAVLAAVERLGIPVLQTWAGLGLLNADHPLRIGPFGVYGPRLGNFVVQNADLLICIGTRLSQNVTGGMLASFAREATIAMVDVDPGEMSKFDGRGIRIDLRIESRAENFLADLLGRDIALPRIRPWLDKIAHWRQVLPRDIADPPSDGGGCLGAYEFVDELQHALRLDESVFVDTGGNLSWICNGLRLRQGQRLQSAWNNTPMGYALPAAIGASVAALDRPVTCVIGDGGMMVCLGELTTLRRHQLDVKVLIFNNHGHGIQKQTLETWLDGHYVGVDEDSGLSFADFRALGEAVGIPSVTISRSSEMADQLKDIYARVGPVLCNVEITPDERLLPYLRFGAPLEDQLPALPSGFLGTEMIVREYDQASGIPIRPSIGV